MAVESYDPLHNAVSVTPAAVEHFRQQLGKTPEANAVRLSIKESGCTGYRYVIDLVPNGQDEDLQLELGQGVQLLIDKKSLNVVSGTKIDFVTEGVNRQLQFLNPNAKDYCGCGESFNVN